MKRNASRSNKARWLAFALAPALLIPGCGPASGPDPAAAADQQEAERLRVENEGLAHARTENQEVQRLKKEVQDLPRIRSQYREASRLRDENEQLRQQVAKLAPAAAAAAQAAQADRPGAAALGQNAQQESEPAADIAQDEGAIHEGDDILVEPKQLAQLMPDFDWENLERTKPIGIRSLLERDGSLITNVSQLYEYGITNFVIQRAIPDTNAPPQP